MLRNDFASVFGGNSLCGRRTVRGTATFAAFATRLSKNLSSADHQIRAVERHFVRDAVEDQRVRKDAVVFQMRDLDWTGVDLVAAARVDRVDQCPGKRVFHAEEDSDAFFAHEAGMLRGGGGLCNAWPHPSPSGRGWPKAG
jgi:hypothetical protein